MVLSCGCGVVVDTLNDARLHDGAGNVSENRNLSLPLGSLRSESHKAWLGGSLSFDLLKHCYNHSYT